METIEQIEEQIRVKNQEITDATREARLKNQVELEKHHSINLAFLILGVEETALLKIVIAIIAAKPTDQKGWNHLIVVGHANGLTTANTK